MSSSCACSTNRLVERIRKLDELCFHNGITSVEAQAYAWAADLESWEIPADGKKGGGKDSNGCSKGSK